MPGWVVVERLGVPLIRNAFLQSPIGMNRLSSGVYLPIPSSGLSQTEAVRGRRGTDVRRPGQLGPTLWLLDNAAGAGVPNLLQSRASAALVSVQQLKRQTSRTENDLPILDVLSEQ